MRRGVVPVHAEIRKAAGISGYLVEEIAQSGHIQVKPLPVVDAPAQFAAFRVDVAGVDEDSVSIYMQNLPNKKTGDLWTEAPGALRGRAMSVPWSSDCGGPQGRAMSVPWSSDRGGPRQFEGLNPPDDMS